LRRAYLLIAASYLIGLCVAIAAGWLIRRSHPFVVVGVADLAGTIAVFVFSRIYQNSSFYDPYWSVAPLPIGIYSRSGPSN
jgi:hypothetical protein